ncbi:UDP-glucose 6-dehydrogenase [Bacillus wiedmannii]|uniref:UDP-glucose 6-dehydrogenase n=1 Tax=Bacillus wiedmannii TaxID=1890302 RepID=A0A2B5KAH5_9BACI|nr:UDP-glucose/GDP-mannose dehydrogenase family protein [Bacillus wiedmannii]PEK04145.1 UDP-glucose 6-dehydrogenase [Bacillus wiedmannii]PEL80774.1 UDP-glucose 6-dehydrogenase [Bacillus wiedmannii]PEM33349.1 UDP-glucose 6-dehydrogenase [Bacillus wiedmannii]PEM90925.1 UDP-glucose 6-dehydrogenase [Bacillus wiedmannii]PEO89272.1 UDP-glucose 6-dehydrogenase [Bacillus wiedmannii]
MYSYIFYCIFLCEKEMKITIIGTGYVGLITGVGLAMLGHSVTCFDINDEKIERIKQGDLPIYEAGLYELINDACENDCLTFTTSRVKAFYDAEFIFIAVGTPSLLDGTADLTYIRSACDDIGTYATNDIIVVTKSTVPVGTNDVMRGWIEEKLQNRYELHIVSNPEFLREGSGIYDFFQGDRIVIGADNEEAARKVENLYSELRLKTYVTNIKSAEMIKYASNAFLATKISFINEISNICEKVGANVLDVAKGMGMDKRIGASFLNAGIGYGGSCFPKDTKALVQIAGNVAHDFRLLKAVIEVNNKQQLLLIEKAKKVLNMNKKRIAVLGAAFKPNTDDIRDAPSLIMIKELIHIGADVVLYDPKAIPNMKNIFGETIQYSECIDESIRGASAAFIMTEWEAIRAYPLERYAQLMREPILLDGRNCYTIEDVKKQEIDYYSVGRESICKREFSVIR